MGMKLNILGLLAAGTAGTLALPAQAQIIPNPTERILSARDTKTCLSTLREVAAMEDQGEEPQAQSGDVTCTQTKNGALRVESPQAMLSMRSMDDGTLRVGVRAPGINAVFAAESLRGGEVSLVAGYYDKSYGTNPMDALNAVASRFYRQTNQMTAHLGRREDSLAAIMQRIAPGARREAIALRKQ